MYRLGTTQGFDMLKTTASLFIVTIVSFFYGCSSENANQTKYYYSAVKKSGNFIDSGVEGLEYVTKSGKHDVTAKGGRYEYFYGDMINFYIGNVYLGSSPGASVLTPKELAMFETKDLNLSIYDDAVVNRVRFLLSLDSNTSVGIQIDAQTREDARHWQDLNFSLQESDFTTQLLSNTDLNASSIVSKTDALAHFERALRCAYSGAYRGKWTLPSGAKEGFVGILIQASGTIVAMGDGQQVGEEKNTIIYSVGTHDVDTGTYTFSNQTWYFDPIQGHVITTEPTDINGSGKSVGYDMVIGEFTQNDQHGVYEARRVASGRATTYRYTGFGYRADGGGIGMFTFDLERDGNVTGMIHDSRTNEEPSMHGTIDYKTGSLSVIIESDPAIIMHARIDFAHFTPDLNLTWESEDGSNSGTAVGIGCQLQEP